MTLSPRVTPALGWNSWNAYRCNGLTQARSLANAALVRTGLREKGYRYVVVDDCWQAQDGSGGHLVPDRDRFPDGIDGLARLLADRGLELGLYLAPGRRTCAEIYDRYGRREGLGSHGHEEQDLAQLFDWGVRYLKLDWCRADAGTDLDRQDAFRRWSTRVDDARPEVVLSISDYGRSRPLLWASGFGHSCRTTGDIAPQWGSALRIARRTQRWSSSVRPGAVSDPDMRLWLKGAGLRTVAGRAGVDRKTARRYVQAAPHARTGTAPPGSCCSRREGASPRLGQVRWPGRQAAEPAAPGRLGQHSRSPATSRQRAPETHEGRSPYR